MNDPIKLLEERVQLAADRLQVLTREREELGRLLEAARGDLDQARIAVAPPAAEESWPQAKDEVLGALRDTLSDLKKI